MVDTRMGIAMHSTLKQVESPRFEDDPHDAPIAAPDIVPADWAERGPPPPANDAVSRERLFAEIRSAAETTMPVVDTSFRASDVNDIPGRKKNAAVRAWIKRGAMAFVFALVSAIAAAAWKHHGNAATEAVASWVPLPSASSPASTEDAAAATQQADATAAPATDQQTTEASPAQAVSTAGVAAADAEQQIQSMARDLAAMGQQIAELRASIDQLKANQQALAAVPPPATKPAVAKPQPKISALPRPAPPPVPSRAPRPLAPTTQASAAPPPYPAAAAPPAYPPPPAQATVQPNGEPVVRPPAPMPLLPDR